MTKLFALALVLSTSAFSHPLDLAYFDATPDDKGAAFRLTLNSELAAMLFRIPPHELTPLAAQARFVQWGPLVLRGDFSKGGTPCVPSFTGGDRKDTAVILSGRIDCAATAASDELRWTADYFHGPPFPSTYQVLVRWSQAGKDRLVTLEKGRPDVSFQTGGAPTLKSFIVMGVEHVGAHPNQWRTELGGWKLPDGIDHILFILGMVLCGGTLWQLMGNATGFTVGHSLTLALAATNVIRLPSRWVESAIALSICYVACMALLKKGTRHGYRVAFLFGLVHGLGFATALLELNLNGSLFWKALLGYNLGVEFGQIIVLSLALPLLALLRRTPRLFRVTTATASGGIALSGLYWFIQRAFAL